MNAPADGIVDVIVVGAGAAGAAAWMRRRRLGRVVGHVDHEARLHAGGDRAGREGERLDGEVRRIRLAAFI